MNDMNDDEGYDDYDPMNETDPEVRELRMRIAELEAESFRQQAMLDQLAASARESEEKLDALRADQEEVRAKMAELERRIDEMKLRWDRERKLRAWLIPLTWLIAASSVAFNLLF